MKQIKTAWRKLTGNFAFVRKRREKRLLIKMGASFMDELKTNVALRKVVMRHAPKLHARMNQCEIRLTK